MALSALTPFIGPALKGLATGVAIGGAAGLVGARGNPSGIPAGMMGSIGGGVSGAFSGGVLGAIGGIGLAAAAMFHPASREFMGKHIGNVLGGKATRGFTLNVARQASRSKILPQGMRQHFRGAAALPNEFARIGRIKGENPQAVAMRATIRFLEDKRMRMWAVGIGAGVGATAGIFAGTPLGIARRGYQAGANV